MTKNKPIESRSLKTVLQKMTEVAPYYIAKYVDWYLTSPEDRGSWDDLCKCDINYKLRNGGYKSEQVAIS